MCCWPEAQVSDSVNAYLRRRPVRSPVSVPEVRIWEDFGRRAAHGRPPLSSGQNPIVIKLSLSPDSYWLY